MSGSAQAAFLRYETERDKVSVACRKLQASPSDSAERSLIWSAFIQATKGAVAALVRSGMLDTRTKGVGHRIKNWENSDPVFRYLLHVRNAEAHAEEHDDALPNPVRPQSLVVGGNLFCIEGSGSVTMVGNTVNGVQIPDGVYSLGEEGQVFVPSLDVGLAYSPMQIEFNPVKDRNGNSHAFPFDIVPSTELAEVFSVKHVLEKLAAWENELRLNRESQP